MKASEQTLQQIERAIRKIADRYPSQVEATVVTDVHIRVWQETGEIRAYDDDDRELWRCVVEQWIDNKDDDFYQQVTIILRQSLAALSDVVDNMSIIKPYSFVLEDEEGEQKAELYVADDDTIIIGGDIMEGLSDDLNSFMEQLFGSAS